MSFDAYAECPSFFADEESKQASEKKGSPSSHHSVNGPEYDLADSVDQTNPFLVKNGESDERVLNQHYAQPYIESTIAGKPMFSLHRHSQANTIPCLTIDGLALETIFRMMKIQFNVRYDVEKEYKPAYINHEGYLLTGMKKVLHYLNLRSKLGVDGHLSPQENAVVRCFNMLIIDQTSFIVDFYRYHENYDSWKDVMHDISKKGTLKNMKTKRKSHKLIREKMLSLGFYNWCEEGIKSVAKEDFRTLSLLLGNKKYYMGDTPCVLDCISFALISNLIHCKHINPLVAMLKTEFNNLTAHCERIKSLFWPDWEKSIIKKQKPTHRSWSFSYKRFSLRHKHKPSKYAIVTSKNEGEDLTPQNGQSNETTQNIKHPSPVESKTIELTTRSDIPSEPGMADQIKLPFKENNIRAAQVCQSKDASVQTQAKPSKKETVSGGSTSHSLGLKCNILKSRKSKQKKSKKHDETEIKPQIELVPVLKNDNVDIPTIMTNQHSHDDDVVNKTDDEHYIDAHETDHQNNMEQTPASDIPQTSVPQENF